MERGESLVEGCFGGGKASFFDQITIPFMVCDVGVLLSEVQSCEKHVILIQGSVSPYLAATKVDCVYLVSL